MTKHIPTPWEARPVPEMNMIAIAQAGKMYPHAYVHASADKNLPLTEVDYATAAFLVRAANAYDELATAIASHLWVGQDDDATRDVWIDIAPSGDFKGEVWKRLVYLDRKTGRIVDGEWEYSSAQDIGFDRTDRDVPAAVLAEYQRVYPDAAKLAHQGQDAAAQPCTIASDTIHPYIAVTGRLNGDDEDTLLVFENMTAEQAKEAFKDEIHILAEDATGEAEPDRPCHINTLCASTAPINTLYQVPF